MESQRSGIGNIFAGTAIAVFFFDVLVNLRLWVQIGDPFRSLYANGDSLHGFFKLLDTLTGGIAKGVVSFASVFGVAGALLLIKVSVVFFQAVYVFVGTPGVDSERPPKSVYWVASFSALLFFVSYFFSPFYAALSRSLYADTTGWVYFAVILACFVGMLFSFGKIGKWVVYSMATGGRGSIEDDPFGHEERHFNQTVEKLENAFSVNIPYKFKNARGVLTNGWINFVNVFRAAMVIGTPGSGKSYTFFLAAIEQLISKGFTMLIYDFKYKDLSNFAFNVYKREEEKIKKLMGGILPRFCVLTLDNIYESERCNVLQPHLIEDFTVDAYGISNIFLMALNRSWATKEGDFFPDSAKNLTAASVWGLRQYEGGKYCSIPHLVEFLSMDTNSIIKCLIAMKDNSLSNVIKPFEEALQSKAVEQLQGQMGTVRIALSRLTSPRLYWVLTEDPTAVPFNLDINSKTDPKILCLGSSGKNQMVNNIFFSVFIAQIFRLVNVKGRFPLGVMLDEVVTLSFPKGTLDTIIATGRSNLISVWLGFQDLSQLVRDFTKDVAEALFKMVGNTVAGNVADDSAERISKRIGKIRIRKQSMNTGSKDPSWTVSEQEVDAVPANFFSSMSQGVFGGQLADNFDQRLKTKVFYGESAYVPPFQKDPLPYSVGMTPFWQGVFDDCGGMLEVEKAAFIDGILQENFDRIRQDILEMKDELMAVVEDQ